MKRNFIKTISLLLIAMMIVPIILFESLAQQVNIPQGYTGIYDVVDLYCIRNNLGGKFILMSDIDLSDDTALGGEWDTNGYGWLPIGQSQEEAFTGTLDGNGHKISGIEIRNSSSPYIGIFGCIVGGSIRNLIIDRPSITSDQDYSAVICGYSSNSSFTNIQVNNSLVVANKYYISVICGYSDSSTFENVKINKTTIKNSKFVTNDIFMGAICGYMLTSKIMTSNAKEISIESIADNILISTTYNQGSVCDYFTNPKTNTGGLVGYGEKNSTIELSWSSGISCHTIKELPAAGFGHSYVYQRCENNYCGGIIGNSDTDTDISDCYSVLDITSDINRSAGPKIGGITGGSAKVTNCISLCSLKTNGYSTKYYRGGISADTFSELEKNYYLSGTAEFGKYNTTDTPDTAIPVTLTQLKYKSVLANLDFEKTWFINLTTGVEHPQLKENPETSVPLHVHSFSILSDTATCLEEGTITYSCYCGYSFSELSEKKGHTISDWIIDYNPTCTCAGSKHTICLVCKETIETSLIPPSQHNYQNIKGIEPKCFEEGYTEGIYCANCDTWFSGHQVILQTNHVNAYEVEQINSTTNSCGYTAGTYCPDCNTWISGHEVIPQKENDKTSDQNKFISLFYDLISLVIDFISSLTSK